VVVISPQPTYNWIPSNIWVGVGLMKKEQALLPLARIYKRHEIESSRLGPLHSTQRGIRRTPDPRLKLNGHWKEKQGNARKSSMTF